MQPCAAATPSATVRSRSHTPWRVRSETARIVPWSRAVSGITLWVEPAPTCATVSTAGSNTSTVRVIIDWSASTSSQATGTGSVAHCGVDAWPPRPVTTISNSSADASAAPGFQATMPAGTFGATWMANAPSTPSSTPSSIMIAAPPLPSSPGWNMNRTRPGRSSRRAANSRAAPTSIAVWAS